MELSEAESATKIRLRYLRAMENEQWDVLPGGAYTRAFIRTYASYLGLDGERLADDFRRRQGPVPEERTARVEAAGSIERRRPRRRGLGAVVVVAVVLVGLLVGIGLAGDDEEAPDPTPPAADRPRENASERARSALTGVRVELDALAEVWVCLVDADGKELVDGQILQPGEREGPFLADGFSAAFGNGEVEMLVDGESVDLPPSSSPVGYEIGPDGRPEELVEGERPSCE